MATSRKSILAIAAAGLVLGACATGPYYGDTNPYYDDGYRYPNGYAYGPGPYYAPGPYYGPGYYVGPSVSLGFGYVWSDRHSDSHHGRR
jgi:hypothetical protein